MRSKLTAHAPAAPVSSAAAGVSSDPDVPGQRDGDAIRIGKLSVFGRTVWIGTEQDATNAAFLQRREISVVVRCKDGYTRPPKGCPPNTRWVNGSLWDCQPGKFPFAAEGGVSAQDLFNWAIVNMCKQVDESGDGDVLFFCKAGRHRSYAGAVAYIMWSVRQATLDSVRAFIEGLHPRFQMNEDSFKDRRGFVRRGLAGDLKAWQAYLLDNTPQSLMREIPVTTSQ